MGQEEQRTFLLYGRVGLWISLLIVTLGITCNKKPPTSDDNNPPPQEYDPRNISRTPGNSYGPSIAVGTNGEVYVAWMEAEGLFFRYKGTDGNWSEIETLATMNWAPHLASDPYGNVHLVWEDHHDTTGVDPNYEIFYRMRRPDGTWTEVKNISNNPGTSTQPRIAVDPSGTVHVVWNDGLRMKYTQKPPDGTWSEPEEGPIYIVNPNIAVDAEGGLHLVTEQGGGNDVLYLYRSPTGEWSEPVNISESRWVYSWYASITVDEGGKPWVLWTENDGGAGWNTGIIYYAKMMGDTWAQPESIPGTRAGHAWPRGKRLFFYGGKKYLLWGDGYYEIFLGETEGDLDAGVEVIHPFAPPGSPYPEAVLDERRGVIHVVWSAQEEPGNYEIFYDEIPLD